MQYTISQAAERTGLSAHTLRFYDREGLLPFVGRNAAGSRVFVDSDFEWLELIHCLKNTGMQIRDIARFIALCMQGEATLEQRLALFQEHKRAVERQQEEIGRNIRKLDCKVLHFPASRQGAAQDGKASNGQSISGGEYMQKNYLGADIAKLGFGLMRLPMLGDEIDIEQVKTMVDRFMQKGFTYFDTAYVYHGGHSEEAAREAIVKRYPRDSFRLATKLPIWEVKEKADLQKIVDTSLARAGVDYFDFYLLHSLEKSRLPILDEFGAWDFLKGMKQKGQAKHIGFSFHDKAEVLDEILTKHPEAEFVQLQINYVDWESDSVQSRKCYEVAMKHNVPVIIMEPVKGGALAAMTPEIQGMLKAANPGLSVASWAVRFAASLDGVVTVLSGMSTLEQMEDNLSFMADFKPVTEDEKKVLAAVLDKLAQIETIPCTACKYCVDDCPQRINIPQIFSVLNNYKVYDNLVGAKRQYGFAVRDRGLASACIQCGSCEGHCPQHISIIEELKVAAKAFE